MRTPLLRENRSGDSLGGVPIHALGDVAVNVCCYSDRGVTKSLRDHFHGYAVSQRERRVSMPQVVNRDSWKTALSDYSFEEFRDSAGMPGQSIFTREDMSAIDPCWPPSHPLLDLICPPFSEDTDCLGIKSDLPLAVVGLRGRRDYFVVCSDKRAND